MDASNVQPMIEPDAGQMLRHVEHLFGGDLDGCHNGKIELAWTDTDDGHLRHAAIYGTDELEELVERAVKENRIPGQNVYIGQALRRDDIPPFGRCNDKDFLALTTLYVDLDDDGVVATARTSYRHRGCPPTAVVVTGRHPHVRAQMLWRLETPERDAEVCRRQNEALADALDGDPKVTNPSRVMRLGGSIAWPTKPGRIIERTEFVTFDDDRPKVYYPGQLAKAFPDVDIAASPSPGGRTGNTPAAQHAATLDIGSEFEGVTVEACIATIRAGQQWHNNMVRLTGHWIARGWSDAEVIAAAEGLTLEGYTVDQTRREVVAMISGGRAKWNIANPAHEVKDASPPVLRATPLARLVFEELPSREWVVKRRLMRKFVSLLYGAGGLNKSSFTMQEAVGVALGRAINGETFTVKQAGRVWIYNNEDPIDELHRRLAAICINWSIDPRKLESRLFLDSGLERRLIVTKREHNIAVATPDVDGLISEIQRHGIDLLVVDPFVRVHQVDENDNPAIDMVVQQFSRIATQCNCCISLIHHGISLGWDSSSAIISPTFIIFSFKLGHVCP